MFSSYIFLIIMTQSFAPVKPFDDHVYDSFITVYENNSKSLILLQIIHSQIQYIPTHPHTPQNPTYTHTPYIHFVIFFVRKKKI